MTKGSKDVGRDAGLPTPMYEHGRRTALGRDSEHGHAVVHIHPVLFRLRNLHLVLHLGLPLPSPGITWPSLA